MSLSIRSTRPGALGAAARDEIARFVTPLIPYPRARLEASLDRADYVWLCRDGGALVGTTAVSAFPVRHGGRAATLLYTAVVAVAPTHRRRGLIERMGLRSFLREKLRAPRRTIYWLSLAASPAGYLQMARNFAGCEPRVGRALSPERVALVRQVMAPLGATEIAERDGNYTFPDDLAVSDPAQDSRRWDRADPDVDFFLRANPAYETGTTLACVTPLTLAELVSAGARRALKTR